MSIQEQAQQLLALADQVPTQSAVGISHELESLTGQVAGILGDTSSAQEIHGQIGAITGAVQELTQGLEQLRQVITDKAHYHQQG